MPFKKSQTYIIFKKLNYSIYHKEYQSDLWWFNYFWLFFPQFIQIKW